MLRMPGDARDAPASLRATESLLLEVLLFAKRNVGLPVFGLHLDIGHSRPRAILCYECRETRETRRLRSVQRSHSCSRSCSSPRGTSGFRYSACIWTLGILDLELFYATNAGRRARRAGFAPCNGVTPARGLALRQEERRAS